jgi:hypothetical protein
MLTPVMLGVVQTLVVSQVDFEPERWFVRGDPNLDMKVDLGDAVTVLDFLFRDGPAVGCLEAADANGDLAAGGAVDIADVVYLVLHLFASSRPPPPPYPDCGNATQLVGCEQSACPVVPCPASFHGCMVEGVECPVFRTDEGLILELMEGEAAVPPVGWCGTVVGAACRGCASICQQGMIFRLCEATPDHVPPLVTTRGCVVQGVECPVFRADDGAIFELRDGDAPAPDTGWCGTIQGLECEGCASICQQGPILTVLDATPDDDGCAITVHGCVKPGVTCPVFESDDGRLFLLFPGPAPSPSVGWCGTIRAGPCVGGCISICQQGQAVSLCDAVPDSR